MLIKILCSKSVCKYFVSYIVLIELRIIRQCTSCLINPAQRRKHSNKKRTLGSVSSSVSITYGTA